MPGDISPMCRDRTSPLGSNRALGEKNPTETVF
jgi:hypothetical protein